MELLFSKLMRRGVVNVTPKDGKLDFEMVKAALCG